MKILHVISSVDPKGGGPIEGVNLLSTAYRNLNVQLEICCLDSPEVIWVKNSKTKVHALGPAYGRYGFCLKLLPWLKENAHKYDAVIVNGIWQFHGLAVWLALAGTTTPYYVFTHGMLDPWFKHTYPLKHIKKWLYWPWAEYRVLRDARRVIFTCEEERLLARESFWLYKVKEAVTAYGVADPPVSAEELRSLFMSRYPELKDKRIILFLSRIHEKKGCDILIKAFAKLANRDENLHLVMAGPDQTGWVVKLQALAVSLGISNRISWPGMLMGELKWGAYYAAEVFCLPSHQENFGIVVAEALACGKPVLISNKVNIWREIESEYSGFIDDDTLEGTQRNLNRWLALDEGEYLKMCQNALSSFSKNFHVKYTAKRLIDIIQNSQ